MLIGLLGAAVGVALEVVEPRGQLQHGPGRDLDVQRLGAGHHAAGHRQLERLAGRGDGVPAARDCGARGTDRQFDVFLERLVARAWPIRRTFATPTAGRATIANERAACPPAGRWTAASSSRLPAAPSNASGPAGPFAAHFHRDPGVAVRCAVIERDQRHLEPVARGGEAREAALHQQRRADQHALLGRPEPAARRSRPPSAAACRRTPAPPASSARLPASSVRSTSVTRLTGFTRLAWTGVLWRPSRRRRRRRGCWRRRAGPPPASDWL